MDITRAFFGILLAAGCVLALAGCQAAGSAQEKTATKSYSVYIGTFTRNNASKGIYLFDFDADTGLLTNQRVAAEVSNPGFLWFHPNHRYAYSVGDMKGPDGKNIGAINSFSINPGTRQLTLLNQQPSAGGGPCFVSIDPAGKNALVANYGSGGVSILPVNPDGTLSPASSVDQHHGSGPVASRQQGPHAHSFITDPAGRFAFSPDLGTDKVYIYKLDSAAHTITPNDPPAGIVPPGSGPRHMAFHPNNQFAYVVDEVSGAVTAFAYDAHRGALTPLQTIRTIPADYTGPLNTAAEVKVHPSGKFLYASNRGHDSIAIFSIASDGHLTFIAHEHTQIKIPRNFNIDPTGQNLIVANQGSDSLTLFRINPATGLLTLTQHIDGIGSPVCVKFLEKE